jgi:REP element-mobilizing transposase RayT
LDTPENKVSIRRFFLTTLLFWLSILKDGQNFSAEGGQIIRRVQIRTLQDDKDQIYFCTITCLYWINLFQITNLYNEIYKWFNILENDTCKIIGYVIMPNHMHLMLYIPESAKGLNTYIANGKRFMAYEIIRRLKSHGQSTILDRLSDAVTKSEIKSGKIHKVFQSSFDSKICESEKFILQKLDYMHHNPVSGKWNLVEDFTDYPHSSAKFYELNEQGIYCVTHYKDITG